MLSSCIVIALCFLFRQVSARGVADIQPVGNFLVAGCGPRFSDVSNILQQMTARLNQVIETMDGSEGGELSDQYTAFFDGVDQSIIRSTLANMADGNDVASNLTPTNFRRPSVTCLETLTSRHRSWATKCRTGNSAIWIESTQLIVLCPGFFNLKTEPVEDDCSTAVDRGTYLSGPTLATTQVTVLVEAMIHMFISAPVLYPEVFGLNPCMSLSEIQSPHNPQNYAFFVGNVIAECDCWQGSQYKGDNRELLAISNDLSNSNGTAVLPLDADCGTDEMEVALGLCKAGPGNG